MSIVRKIKDILFEEEDTEEIKIVPEVKEVVKEEKQPVIKFNDDLEPKENVTEQKSERELFNDVNSFKFPEFDEVEFDTSYRKAQQPKNNALEFERKKTYEKNNDYGRRDYGRNEFSKYDKIDNKEIIDRKKFKPSPIISPVYGVLNKDYTPDDVINKDEVASNIDIDAVRKKAFEAPVEEKEMPKRKTIDEIVDEPVVTFFEEKQKNDTVEFVDEKSVDEIIEETNEIVNDITPKEKNLDAIEEELEKLDVEKDEIIDDKYDDELDNDLFDLIDSMYDDGEEDNK